MDTLSKGYLIDGRPILAALRAVGHGEFATRLPLDWTGTSGEVPSAFNHMINATEIRGSRIVYGHV
jgi:hypothetical protein